MGSISEGGSWFRLVAGAAHGDVDDGFGFVAEELGDLGAGSAVDEAKL